MTRRRCRCGRIVVPRTHRCAICRAKHPAWGTHPNSATNIKAARAERDVPVSVIVGVLASRKFVRDQRRWRAER